MSNDLGWILVITNIIYILLQIFITFECKYKLKRFLSVCNIVLLILLLLYTINNVILETINNSTVGTMFCCYLIALIITSLTFCIREE